ncbi:MAG TPA: PLP-dependent transferase [Thermoanaerobaculia bacterium]|nr:PLP-dependent transferase [Thermoanaerobaculia bacterium]
MIRGNGDRLETRLTHAGREDLARLGVHAPPLDLSTTYPLHDLEEGTASLDALAEGRASARSPVYARLHNPTVARWERAIAELEAAEAAVGFASGMAAITALLLAVAAAEGRRHVVAVRPIYGGTDHLLSSGLLGLETTFVEPARVGEAVRADTALVLLETPANPTVALVDIEAVARRACGVPVAVDSTFATPILQRPLACGAAFSVHSATKFLGGHGDVLGGVVATSEAWAAKLRQVRILTGAVLHPMAAWLLHRSLPTLGLRVRAAQAGAGALAERLAGHPEVARVLWPGLPGGDPEGLIGRQMSGPGAVLAFELRGGYEAARRVLGAVRRITPAVSLGSADTLIQHPAGLTHRLVDPEARRASGVGEGLVRLSVGLEDPEDLWADLEAALSGAWSEEAEAIFEPAAAAEPR